MELCQHDGDDFFHAEMNAGLVKDAERYHRSMYYWRDDSWNRRDIPFFQTLVRLLKQREGSKAVVWAHNSHNRDARSTSRGQVLNEIDIGQLCKEQRGASCSINGAVRTRVLSLQRISGMIQWR